MVPRLGVGVGLTAMCVACFKVPTQSAQLALVDDAAVTAIQLQMQVYEMGRWATDVIQLAADSVRSRDSSSTVRRRALLWKIAAIPLVEEASLRSEPTIGAVDLWAFAVQQRNYFQTGDGKDAFGAEQWIARAAADTIEHGVRVLVGQVRASKQISDTATAAVERWAGRHPLYGPDMRRSSVVASEWKALGIEETSLAGTAARMERGLNAISSRLGYLNENMLNRVVWQMQLAATSVPWTGRPDTMLSGLTLAARQIGGLAATGPAVVESERRAVFRDLAGERAHVFGAIDTQRVATLDALDAERKAAFDDLRVERTAALASTDSIAQRSIDHAGRVASRLAREVAALTALLVLVATIGASIVVSLWRRRAPT